MSYNKSYNTIMKVAGLKPSWKGGLATLGLSTLAGASIGSNFEELFGDEGLFDTRDATERSIEGAGSGAGWGAALGTPLAAAAAFHPRTRRMLSNSVEAEDLGWLLY